MDIIVLCALGATIFYAMRLSQSLNNFKQYRGEFQQLLAELSDHIEKAYGAVDSLKNTSQKTGADLNEAVNEAKFTLDEMMQVNEASESLARRLEMAASQGRQAAQEDRLYDVPPTIDEPVYEEPVNAFQENLNTATSWQDTLNVRKAAAPEAASDGFAIRDPDYEDDAPASKTSNVSSFGSQAEKELFEALQRNKN